MATMMLVAIFPSRTLLTKALDHLTALDDLTIHHAAVVARSSDGRLIVLGDDISAAEGGVAGGTFGAALSTFGLVQLGVLALPALPALAALGAGVLVGGLVGGVTGRFAANLLDSGEVREELRALSTRLETGKPALVLSVDDAADACARITAALQPYRAEMLETDAVPA